MSHCSFFGFNPQQQLYKESAEKSHLMSQAHPILTDVAGTYGFRDPKLKHKVSWHWYGSNPKQNPEASNGRVSHVVEPWAQKISERRESLDASLSLNVSRFGGAWGARVCTDVQGRSSIPKPCTLNRTVLRILAPDPVAEAAKSSLRVYSPTVHRNLTSGP